MNSMMDQKPRSLHVSSSVLRLAAIALLAVSSIAGQTRVFPSNSANTNNAKRNHNATIHSADSSEGSRVSIASDQSLNDYEAYRRGDRFYVKVPAAEVPRAEAVRGRGFADVTAQRSGSNTLLSFRLQPGASAHVEQRGNRLDVVIAAAGGGSAPSANRSGNFQWSDTSGSMRPANSGTNRAPSSAANNRGAGTNSRGDTPAGSNRNSSSRDNSTASSGDAKSKAANANSSTAGKGTNKNSPTSNSNSTDASNKSANPNSSTNGNQANVNSAPGLSTNSAAGPGASSSPVLPANSGLSTPAPAGSPTLSNLSSPTPPGAAASRSDFWTSTKERGRYLLLLAQLNPIPVAVGAALLILIIALLLMQRRRARSTRRTKPVTQSKSRPTGAVSSRSAEAAAPVVAAAVAATPVPASVEDDVTEHTRIAEAPPVASTDNGRKERVSRAAEEANKIFAGQPYDESIVGSDDRETRRMVGAELLSAMVGRNTERRDRARAAFMKHGYFDDATRDLRVATSENERAAAARRLSFVQDPEATPHLVGALNDQSPDVRRAAVEALMDQRDPAAIAPLNGLLQNETDRKVPRHLIEQAIEACATNPAQMSGSAPQLPTAPPPSFDNDREVIEI
ncbi:MAG TPA: HEAT repeat domain-containing protein [Pyrinomonadaceae bacterium]|nr:HEAT repeat domain-containing protein [Pyrinomonadaceae bacterium]